ncbi:MAG TPA: DUF4412 domain-containing protein [Acetobacteraceae bacterium]|nr:DUF4412 domain-containing protein [Acetobacteraceae bacterium]
MRRTAPLIAAALLATPALAQDRPPLFPTRDVAVTYRMAGGPAQGQEMSMSWLAAGRMMRVDLPGGMGFMVADQQNQRGFMVMEAQRMIMDVPMAQAAGHMRALENARFTRGGSDTVAGTPCTVWRYEGQGQSGTACVTADGVLLRSQTNAGGQNVTMEAVRVAYGPQDPARYQRPQGYQSMQMPQGMPQAPR